MSVTPWGDGRQDSRAGDGRPRSGPSSAGPNRLRAARSGEICARAGGRPRADRGWPPSGRGGRGGTVMGTASGFGEAVAPAPARGAGGRG